MARPSQFNLPQTVRLIVQHAQPLPEVNADDFAKALDRWADRRVLMLGEARHGTAQFYQARAAITRRMIETQGATIEPAATSCAERPVLRRRLHVPGTHSSPDRARP